MHHETDLVLFLFRVCRPTVASARAARSRSTVMTRAYMDPSSLEVSAALTALIASGAAVFSLASVIRKANGFDARDKALMATTVATTVPAAVIVQEIIAEKTEEPVFEKRIEVEVEPIKNEIAIPVVAAAAISAPAKAVDTSAVAKAEEKKPIIVATPVVAAASNPAPAAIKKAVEKTVAEIPTPVTTTKPADIQVGEAILFNFENTPEAISLSSQDEDVTTTRITEPTLPKADPVVAAAVLEAMTSDAPVGTTAPGSNNNTGGFGSEAASTKTIAGEEPVLELVGAMTAPTSAAEAMEAAREYEARLARVLADANLETATIASTETATAQKQRSQRLVTITEQYQEKIESLWSSYEVKKAQEAVLLSKQEKLTMDLAALDAAQQAQEEAAQADNKFAMAAQKVIAALAAIWAFIMALVAKVTGGRFGGTNTPAGASA